MNIISSKYAFTLSLLLALNATAFACETSNGDSSGISTLQTLTEERHGLWQTAEAAYANPAVNQWRLRSGYTEGYASRSDRRDSNNPDPRQGTGDYMWSVGAVTYTKYKSSTLWGDASYSNGKTRAMVWNETGDADRLYPYLIADSIGGDLSRERYRFHGGYADHRGPLAWGVEMGYTATLEYRSVDPRPRNVTGVLDISAGGMIRLGGDYYGGIMLAWQKYKQDNEVTFKSEMGVDKIFHLTGLGHHYNRFAGTGLSTYYTGNLYLAGLSLYPADSHGFFATLLLSRFSFTNILSDLNKLPLASARHDQLRAQAGWLYPSRRNIVAVTADLTLFRHHGSETQFGDATSSVYPVIGCNEMFADNAISVSATGRWGRRYGAVSRFHIELQPGWSHSTTACLEPYAYKEISRFTLRSAVSGSLLVAHHWLLEVDLGITMDSPYGCTLNLPAADDELKALAAIERAAYALESHRSTLLEAHIGVTRSIGVRYALGLSAGCSHTSRWEEMTSNFYDIKINFLF